MVDMDQEGNEIKFFSSKFLVKKYLKMSDKDLELNDKMKQQEIEDLNLAGGDNGIGDEVGVPGEAEGEDLLNKTDNTPDPKLIRDDKKKDTNKKKTKMICDKGDEDKKGEEE